MPKIKYEEKNFSAKTQQTIEQAVDIIAEYQAQGFSLTTRQMFYQFVIRVLIANTERQYKRIGNILSDARRAGLIDWNAIEDRTRYLRRLSFWDSPLSMMHSARDSYHRDLWEDQCKRVEVWIEKDALVGVIQKVCEDMDVPYFSCRGYVSDSEMWRGARRLLTNQDNGQETVVLHLGDHDPSGIDMTRDIEERLRLFTQGRTYVSVKRIALTMDQIIEIEPPPNPAKVTDSRYEGYVAEYGEESWELDALEPQYMLKLVEKAILAECEIDLWRERRSQQEEERKQLEDVISRWGELF